MLRRISTKLVLAVLAAVALPFLGFAWFVDSQMSRELSLKVVLQTLKGVAENLAGQVDSQVRLRSEDVRLWSDSDWVRWVLVDEAEWGPEETIDYGHRPPRAGAGGLWGVACGQFDRELRERGVYDLILLVGEDGRLRLCNSRDADGEALDELFVRSLFERDYSQQRWFREALEMEPDEVHRVDWHRSRLSSPEDPLSRDDPRSYQIGFASPVTDYYGREQTRGVLYALVNWSHIQDLIRVPSIKDYFRGWVQPDKEPSPYAWIWAADCDTILAHENTTLYGQKVSAPPIDLSSMVQDARERDGGLYREYYFNGHWKNAAFQKTAPASEGGFGWLVGVGMDNDDIYAKKAALHDLLVRATLVVLLVVVLWTMIIARRTTTPIQALEAHTRRVAAGDLDAQIDIDSEDELGELARSFNRMQKELREQRGELVQAEKDRAWRGMARQIAHDIKNPLTPIRLSLDLLERARRDRSPDVEEILDRTLELIRRQFDNLRAIAHDFYEFTGGKKPAFESFPLEELCSEVLELHSAWAEERHVRVSQSGAGGVVWADRRKLLRVLVNLVSNALEAMEEGGELSLSVEREGDWVRLELADTGPGLSSEVRAHLFEPYFTTKSEGTGLGLAIAKRVVDDLGGRIALEPRAGGAGTCARIELPSAEADEPLTDSSDRGASA